MVLYLLFPAMLMMSSYDAIYKHFKKIHHHRVNVLQHSSSSCLTYTTAVPVADCYIWTHRPRKCSSIVGQNVQKESTVVSGNVCKMTVHFLDEKAQDMSLTHFSWQPGNKLSLGNKEKQLAWLSSQLKNAPAGTSTSL